MTKFILSLLIGTILIVACHKKALPVISTRTTEPAAPKQDTASFIPDTATGKAIFAGRCSRCHGLPEIPLYSSRRWDIILMSMIPRARLTREQGIHVTAYIKNNSTN